LADILQVCLGDFPFSSVAYTAPPFLDFSLQNLICNFLTTVAGLPAETSHGPQGWAGFV
jgi:hypothetical protein